VIYLICMKRKIIIRTNPFVSIIIGIVCVVALIFGAFLYGKSTNSQSVATLKEQHDLIIKNEVFTAISLLKTLYEQSEKGELSLEEAKTRGADLLRNIRYGDQSDGYFWADTIEGVNVVLYGDAKVEGVDRWNAFVGGVYYVREIIRNGMKDGGGYTDYYYPKKGESIPLPKRGYSLLFAPFNWVIGTGYYLEDI